MKAPSVISLFTHKSTVPSADVWRHAEADGGGALYTKSDGTVTEAAAPDAWLGSASPTAWSQVQDKII